MRHMSEEERAAWERANPKQARARALRQHPLPLHTRQCEEAQLVEVEPSAFP